MLTAIVFLPLLAALLVGVGIRGMAPRTAHVITCGAVTTAAVLSCLLFWRGFQHGAEPSVFLLRWIESGGLSVAWSLRLDMLTAVMLVVVNVVSAVVHWYSIGYMHHDPHQPRFFAYLSLFTFFMLLLVTADNFLQLFVGWEGVGLCSYLLIGFWYTRPSANAAAIKAFVVNRVGDLGFALGVFAIFVLFGSIEFADVFANAPIHKEATFTFFGTEYHALTVICLLLFIGCMGKSAQLGLHTWLPDAMEGPTPVSALIHAATMVTAGVFLVVRCSPLFELSPDALTVVTYVGALTAFFAATIGMAQNDIKKVIAYSTCSQLGYMFFACGVGAYAAAVFHLMTHAFFKALLFLGAGSVIHAVSDEQDMRKMGGLAGKIKITYALMWIGSLALAGIPLFAGYYSKDMILEAAWAAGSDAGRFAYGMGVAAALLTAFYSWRLLFMTFHGPCRMTEEVKSHIHEAPWVMNAPLLVLAAGAVLSGYVGYHLLQMVEQGSSFWGEAIRLAEDNRVLEAAHQVPAWVKWLPLVVAVSGITLAWLCYVAAPWLPAKVAGALRWIYRLFLNKWYIDELYHALFIVPARGLGRLFWKVGDGALIDGLGPNGLAALSQAVGRGFSRIQSGFLYHYAFVMLIGLAAGLGWIVWHVLQAMGG